MRQWQAPQRHRGRRRPHRDRAPPGGGAAGSRRLGLPEDLGDLVDLDEQLVGHGDVVAALRATRTGQLGRLVEQGVQLRVLLEVRGLEVVGPQHPEVVLDQVGSAPP